MVDMGLKDAAGRRILSRSVDDLRVVVGDVIDEDPGAKGVLKEVDDSEVSRLVSVLRGVFALEVAVLFDGSHGVFSNLYKKSTFGFSGDSSCLPRDSSRASPRGGSRRNATCDSPESRSTVQQSGCCGVSCDRSRRSGPV